MGFPSKEQPVCQNEQNPSVNLSTFFPWPYTCDSFPMVKYPLKETRFQCGTFQEGTHRRSAKLYPTMGNLPGEL